MQGADTRLDVVFGHHARDRIVDVLIISMLIPSAANTSNIFAATPGLVFIPAPISETRPICLSVR